MNKTNKEKMFCPNFLVLVIPFILLGINISDSHGQSISCEYCERQVYMTVCFNQSTFQIDVCKRFFLLLFIVYHFIDFLYFFLGL